MIGRGVRSLRVRLTTYHLESGGTPSALPLHRKGVWLPVAHAAVSAAFGWAWNDRGPPPLGYARGAGRAPQGLGGV